MLVRKSESCGSGSKLCDYLILHFYILIFFLDLIVQVSKAIKCGDNQPIFHADLGISFYLL
jgi:hypothetical protein